MLCHTDKKTAAKLIWIKNSCPFNYFCTINSIIIQILDETNFSDCLVDPVGTF
jgi:hypothetical protein